MDVEEEDIFVFNPSITWSEEDWELVEDNGNVWIISLSPSSRKTLISIEGGIPLPFPREGMRVRFEDRIPVDFEYIYPSDSIIRYTLRSED